MIIHDSTDGNVAGILFAMTHYVLYAIIKLHPFSSIPHRLFIRYYGYHCLLLVTVLCLINCPNLGRTRQIIIVDPSRFYSHCLL